MLYAYFEFPLGRVGLEAVHTNCLCRHTLTLLHLYYSNRCPEDFFYLSHRYAPSDPANAVASLRPCGVRGWGLQLQHRQVVRLRGRRLLPQQGLRLQRGLLPRLQNLRLRGGMRAHHDLRLHRPVRMLNETARSHAQRTKQTHIERSASPIATEAVYRPMPPASLNTQRMNELSAESCVPWKSSMDCIKGLGGSPRIGTRLFIIVSHY